MKKIICLFLMLAMLGCGKENGQKEVVTEKEYQVSEIVSEKENKLEESSKNSEKSFEVIGISTNSNGKPRIEIEFSEDLDGDNLDAYVKISPEVSYKVLKDKNKIIIIKPTIPA